MGDMAEDFRAMKAWRKEREAKRYARNLPYLRSVKGYVLTELTPYQFRYFGEGVGYFCDLYPTNQRYHNLITGERGHYKTAQGFLDLQYKKAKEKKDEEAIHSDNN